MNALSAIAPNRPQDDERDKSGLRKAQGGTMVETKPDEEICPKCKKPLQLLRLSKAAKLVDVSDKTIYGYIEEGSVYAIKVAGKTFRVCKGCLLRPYNPA
jgi:excisionase family DNA binding protein